MLCLGFFGRGCHLARATALPPCPRNSAAFNAHRAGRRLICEPLEPRHLLDAGPLLITEFMAANKGVLADEDGAYSDWIEIHNPTDAPVSLDGWYLTDDSTALTKWQFPSVSIDAGGYLTVFASDKNRTDPAGTLHTNFKLTSDGEYLALVQPDGLTISHEYATAFPALGDNVSFGLPGIAEGVSYHVPTAADAGLGTGWTATGYNDSAWDATSPSSVHITEMGTGTPEYIEIQNLAGTAVDTSGWKVVMRRTSSTDINNTDIIQTSLPSVMYPGQINYWHDAAGATKFDLLHPAESGTLLPTTLSWASSTPLWALILDDRGMVVDFVAWGYTQAQLATFNMTINGFQVTADTAWLGAPVAAASTSTPILSRTGTSDHNNASDFAWGAATYSWWSSSSITTGSIGAPNPNLASTFPTTDPTLGYAAYSVGLNTRIPTDVSWAMQGVNSSIWTRREFESDGAAGLTKLTLRLRYNDGFVAYLNGVEIARNNAPATVFWNSAATASRSLAESIQYVDIDVSAYLGLLRDGVNVLAVQGLNDSVSDANFLLEAELLGAASLHANRYFLAPTPGGPNSAGSSATDLLPQFSQTTGVYYAPFQLTLTTTLPGGVIRYTLDQTDPTEASPAYTGPITISKSTRIRAAVFVPGQPTSLVASESYFVLDPALQSFDSNLGLVVIDTFGQSINQNDYATVSTAFFDASGGNRDVAERHAGVHEPGGTEAPRRLFVVAERLSDGPARRRPHGREALLPAGTPRRIGRRPGRVAPRSARGLRLGPLLALRRQDADARLPVVSVVQRDGRLGALGTLHRTLREPGRRRSQPPRTTSASISCSRRSPSAKTSSTSRSWIPRTTRRRTSLAAISSRRTASSRGRKPSRQAMDTSSFTPIRTKAISARRNRPIFSVT